MREILFRGQVIGSLKWVEGFYFREAGNFIKELPSAVSTETHMVYEDTVGQYTGLTGKNGTKIFEGDILESRTSENKEDWKIWKVCFENGSFAFDSVRKSIKSRRKFKHEQNLLCVEEIEFYGLVKIGNIHDNPELLKEGAE